LPTKGKKRKPAAKPAAKARAASKGAATKKATSRKTAARRPSTKKATKKPVPKKAAKKPAASKPAPERVEAKKPAAKTSKRPASWRKAPEPKALSKPAAGPGDRVGGFEPRIVAFACNWCSYPAADAAGISKMQYPPNARVIRVMCAGRVHPAFVLRALELGADGVLVSGCHFEDCHYLFGARRAAEQFEKAAELVRMLGIERERVRYEQISAAEAPKFARVMHEFVDDIKKIGPSPLGARGRGDLEVPGAVTDETT
jgi:F420-non-reducing hydrogenase iron-sulfur subunit